jgi:hypothetical protein
MTARRGRYANGRLRESICRPSNDRGWPADRLTVPGTPYNHPSNSAGFGLHRLESLVMCRLLKKSLSTTNRTTRLRTVGTAYNLAPDPSRGTYLSI